MRYRVRQIPVSLDAGVRLLLTAVMGLVLAVMVLMSSERAAAQGAVQGPYDISRDEIVAQLSQRYQEKPVAGGLAANGSILEVFSSADGLSWTIIVTRPDGMSSVIAEGEGWSFVAALEGLRI